MAIQFVVVRNELYNLHITLLQNTQKNLFSFDSGVKSMYYIRNIKNFQNNSNVWMWTVKFERRHIQRRENWENVITEKNIFLKMKSKPIIKIHKHDMILLNVFIFFWNEPVVYIKRQRHLQIKEKNQQKILVEIAAIKENNICVVYYVLMWMCCILCMWMWGELMYFCLLYIL